MDWTFWAGGAVILALWVGSRWAFSPRRHAEKTRHLDPDRADAMIDVDRGTAQADVWRKH